MPVRIAQVDREVPQFMGQSTPHLIGNVNNWVKTRVLIQCYSLFESSLTESIEVSSSTAGRTRVKLLNGKWQDEGFSVGDQVYVALLLTDLAPGSSQVTRIWNGGPTAQLIWISPDGTIAEFDDSINGDGAGLAYLGDNKIFPTTRVVDFQSGWDKVYFYKDQVWDAIEVFHNLIPNSEKDGKSLSSIIDGSETRFSYDALTTSNNVPFDMTQLGFKSGQAIKHVNVRALPNFFPGQFNPTGRYNIPGSQLPNIDNILTDQVVQPGQVISVYVIEIIHKIVGVEEDITNITDNEAPQWFFDNEALGDNFLFKLYPQYSNQNIFVASSMDSTLTKVDGNTGWDKENYNGRPTPYSIESVEYLNILGTPLQDLDYGNETRVNILINNPNHTPSFIYTLDYQYLPNLSEQYKNNEYSYANNTFQLTPLYWNTFTGMDPRGLYQEGQFIVQEFGLTHPDGGQLELRELQVLPQGGGQVLITFKLLPNNNFFSYFDDRAEDNRRFLISVGVNNSADTPEESDSTMLFISGNMRFQPVPVGPYPGMTNLFNELPVDPDTSGAATAIAFPEDLWLANTRFTINPTDGITFKSIKPTIELYNTVTGEYIEVDSVNINLQNQPVDGMGVQQINYLGSRGFLTIGAHDKNFMNVIRVPLDDVPPNYAYWMQFGFRIRYEDWIENGLVPADFYDANELNNGFNNYWTWLQQNNWVIRYTVYSTVDRVGTQSVFANSFPIELNDYFEILDITPECRHYNNDTGASLYQGIDAEGEDCNAILNNALTLVEQDYVLNTGTFPTSGIYAETNLEVFQGGGYKSIRTLSTEYEGETTNPLKPTGNNGVFLELILVAPDRLRARCLIDPSLLTGASTDYKISGRIGCKTGNKLPSLPPEGLYNEQYNNKYL